MPWGAIAGAAISAIAGAMSQKAAARKAKKQDAAMLAQGHKNLQKESLLKSDLADYNYVRNEKDLQAGAADYAGMNRVQSFAPGYANTTPALVLPAYPTGK